MSAAAEPYTFVSFSRDPWSDVWLNRHHIMSRIAKQHRVLFASRVPRWEEYYWKLLMHEPIRWRSRQITPTLTDLQPWPWLPRIGQWGDLDRFLQKLHVARIRSSLRRRGWDNRILYIWHPEMENMVGRFDERLVCFHYYDNYAGYTYLTDTMRRELAEQTARLLKRADLVFASGEAMRGLIPREDVHVIPNGVDYELFAAAHDDNEPPPPDMAGIPHPIVAHIGRLNVKIDYALLTEIARRRRDWSVVLLGPLERFMSREQRTSVDALLAEPNAYHIPGKPVWELPRYLRHVDVALMAYRLIGWAVKGFPLKLFEYLAAGKPCVAAPLEENLRYRDAITIAQTPDEWITAIEHWLANDSEEFAQQRMALARANSWDIRCRRILELIESRLQAGSMGDRK